MKSNLIIQSGCFERIEESGNFGDMALISLLKIGTWLTLKKYHQTFEKD